MRKITTDIENPIDNIIIYMAERSAPLYKSLNMVPNHLTTLSLICNVSSAVLLYYDSKYMSALMFLLGYYFDCADGFYARHYDMVTKFGDYYDHINDKMKIIMIVFVMYLKSKCKLIKISPIIIFLGLLAVTHLGCQEKIYSKDESPMLHAFKHLCDSYHDDDVTPLIRFSRYFGTGTFMVCMALLIVTF